MILQVDAVKVFRAFGVVGLLGFRVLGAPDLEASGVQGVKAPG